MGGFSFGERESRALMESYWGRVSEDQRVASLRLAWQDLWAKASLYLPKDDMKMIGEAFVFSSVAHGKQRRHTGEPYIIHTVSVAAILSSMEIDRETIVASLLHDVLEDTATTPQQLSEKFGEDVVILVDGVTKLGKLQFRRRIPVREPPEDVRRYGEGYPRGAYKARRPPPQYAHDILA